VTVERLFFLLQSRLIYFGDQVQCAGIKFARFDSFATKEALIFDSGRHRGEGHGVPNDGVEKVSSAYPAVYQMEYQAEVLELAHSGSNDLKSSMTATTDNLTVLFSALGDTGDIVIRMPT
jgi:hypothetical protein